MLQLPISILISVITTTLVVIPTSAESLQKMNVLYLQSDDMRADMGSYGLPVHTPNLDVLAESSLIFQRSYCQIAVCAPSRQSFMTGLRPDRNGVWNFIDTNPEETTQAIPGHFRDHGYLTLGLGKTFHKNHGKWNAEKYWNTSGPYGKPYLQYTRNVCPVDTSGCILPDEEIWDYTLRQQTLEYLRHAAHVSATTNTPFFLMTGFRDPHAPWAAPQRMYDLYDEDTINVATSKTLGLGTPLIAWSKQINITLSNLTDVDYSYDHPVPDWVIRNQRKAYYSSVSYIDEHIGAILNVLEEEGLANNTIVVFHSDHGYALGEHGYWEKKSNYDLTVRVPLLIKVPGVTNRPGYVHRTKELFDLVDVFPTLSSLAGLPHPMGVDGMDLSGLVKTGGGEIPIGHHPRRMASYHQFPACDTPGFNYTRKECNQVPATDFTHMGYSLRTHRWRYTIWYEWDGDKLDAIWDGDYVDELYDHIGDDSSDMDKWENINLSGRLPNLAGKLRLQIESFFRWKYCREDEANCQEFVIGTNL